MISWVFDIKSLLKAIALHVLILVRPAGIEPATPWFVAKYSIQLSYGRERQNYSTGFSRIYKNPNVAQKIIFSVAHSQFSCSQLCDSARKDRFGNP